MTSEIGERIKKLRNRKNWSLRELEKRTNINYSVLSRIEAGKRPVTDSEIITFSKIFSVSPNYLLDYKEDSTDIDTASLFPYDQLGINQDEFENLTAYQQEVLEWAISEDALFFKNKSDNVMDMLERLEVAYEVDKVMKKRDRKK